MHVFLFQIVLCNKFSDAASFVSAFRKSSYSALYNIIPCEPLSNDDKTFLESVSPVSVGYLNHKFGTETRYSTGDIGRRWIRVHSFFNSILKVTC